MSLSKLLKVIPEIGDVEEGDIFSGRGRCDRVGCKKEFVNLRRHLKAHARVKPLTEIPKIGFVDAALLTSNWGYCNKCDTTQRHLKLHYKRKYDPDQPHHHTFKTKVIPEEGTPPAEDIYSGPGRCDKEGCRKEYQDLRQHYRDVHLKETRPCPTCNLQVAVPNFLSHQDTHSGPAQCSQCHKISTSLRGAKTHIGKYHSGVPGVTAILLDEEEAAAFRTKAEAAYKAYVDSGHDARTLRKMRENLEVYEQRLRNPKDPLYIRKETLKQLYAEYIEVGPAGLMAENSSFISEWQPHWRIPKVVFQWLEKKKTGKRFSGYNFYPDPKIAAIHHPIPTDYPNSSLQRGHFASAADFEEEFLVLPTYYFTNVGPFTQTFNLRVRLPMEHFIRTTADNNPNGVFAFHFPIMEGNIKTIGAGVSVPPAVGTVMIEKGKDGDYITAWELTNDENVYNFESCQRDPFTLMEKAGIPFKKERDSFVYVSEDLL